MAREREILVRLNLRASEYNRGINQAERSTDQLRNRVDRLQGSVRSAERATDRFKGRIDTLHASFKGLRGTMAAGIAVGAVAGFGAIGVAAVRAANDINKLKLQIAAVVAANSDIRDASGKLLQGVDKIRASQALSAELFEQLQRDALKTTATTKELIELMTVALPSAMSQGLTVMQTEKLVVGMSNAMKVLNIEAQQAKSEMRALFSGDITNDADLAKALQIRRQDIEAAREQGTLYDMLLGKLADFNAAAELQSQLLDGALSSARDFGDKLLEIAGQDALGILTEGANELVNELMGDEKATTNLHNVMKVFAEDAGDGMGQLAQAVVEVGRAVIWVINLLGQMDKTQRAWAINVRERTRQGANLFHRGLIWMRERFPASPLVQRDLEEAKQFTSDDWAAISRDAERDRAAVEAMYSGAPRPGKGVRMRGPGSTQGLVITPKPRRATGGTGGRARGGRGRARGAGGSSGADQMARELEQQQEALVREMADAFRHQERITAAYGGGMAGSIRNMEKYLTALKSLPKGHAGAAEEILKIERDLQVERIRASVAAEEKKREEIERTKQAALEAAEAQRAYELQITQNIADAYSMRVDFDLEDQLDDLDEQGAALERLWERGKVNAQDYYTEVQRLRVAELKAQAEADLERLRTQREVLAQQLEQQRAPLQGLVDHAAVAATEGQIAQLDAEMARVGEKFGQDVARTTRENAQAFGYHLSDEVRAGLELAVDGVFSGDLSSVSQGLAAYAKKGLVDALMSTEVGQKVGGLFSGAGGWKGALIAGVLDLIVGSFQDIAKGAQINRDNQRDLDRALHGDDPFFAARDEVEQLRQSLRDRRKSTRKFLGIIPIGSTQGYTTPEEDRQLAELEAKKLAEAAAEEVERRQEEYLASIDRTMRKLELLKRLGKATTQDLIDELTRVLGTADLTEDKALELQAQLLDLQDELRETAEAKWDEQLEDQLTFNEITLEEAKRRVEAEMALVDRSTEHGYQRYRDLRHRLKDLNDQIAEDKAEAERQAQEAAEEAARAAEEAAERFRDAWEEATSETSDFFKRLAQAARNELDFLRNAYDQRFSEEETDLAVDVAYNRRSKAEAEYLLMAERVKALQRQISTLVRGNTTDQDYLTAGNRFQSGAWIEGSRFFANNVGDIPTFLAQLAAEMNRTGASWLSTLQGGQGFQYQANQLTTLTNNYQAALERLGTRDEGIEALRAEIERLNNARDVIKAQIEGGAPSAISDLDIEYQLLRAQSRGDQGAIAAAKKAQIDAQIEERRLALFHEGLMSGQFDIEDQNLIRSRLEAIRSLLKAQVDAEAANRPTDSNPLPVRVVELPPAFALPASWYFRAQTAPILQLGEGAIQINGSGLSDAQLTQAVQQALVNAGSDLTRVVNRQNAIGGAVVRLS